MSRPRPRSAGAVAPAGPPVLRAGSPADLLAIVPYLLGFHPQESLVLLALRRRRVELIARVDLPGGGAEAFVTAASEREWDRVLAQVGGAARSVAPEAVVLIGYSAVDGRAESALDTTVAELADLPVTEVLHADGHRWWSRCCELGCCPGEGTPYAVGESLLAAEAVLAGLSALPDRGVLAALVAGPPPSEVADLEADAEPIRDRLATVARRSRQLRMRRLVADALAALDADPDEPGGAVAGSGPPDRDLSLRLAVLAIDVHVRDVAWSMVEQPSSAGHVALWQAVVRHAPGRLALAPLCLLGVAAWVGGQGALMVCAFTRALQIDPGYGMAQLLSDLNAAAVRPSTWEEVAGPLRAELGLGEATEPFGRPRPGDPDRGPGR